MRTKLKVVRGRISQLLKQFLSFFRFIVVFLISCILSPIFYIKIIKKANQKFNLSKKIFRTPNSSGN